MIATSEALLKEFGNPSSPHRTYPYWVWNGDVNEERITETLEQYAALGCGGVVAHARLGLITEYLSERWFELWAHALSECKRLGLLCNIYDENVYPSGFAGGHVAAKLGNEVGIQGGIAELQGAPIPDNPDATWGTFRLTADGAVTAHDAAGAQADGNMLVVKRIQGRAGHYGGFLCPDPQRLDATQEFIRVTYDAYYEKFSEDFGGAIRFSYNDEPGVRNGLAGNDALYMSDLLFSEFEEEHGYNLREKLGDLFVDGKTASATRFDYYLTVQRLFAHNYYKPIYDWCEAHGIAFTSHLWEHCWPEPFHTPDCMAAYRWLQIPGIDMLAQQFDPDDPDTEVNHLGLLIVKEVVSAANQLGRLTSCEAYGAFGYEATMKQFKRMGDWLLTHGLNVIVEHLGYQTTTGSRKYDWPQSMSDHAAWWKHYGPLANHTARMLVAGDAGKPVRRTLLLHPTTTAWLHATPMEPQCMEDMRSRQGRLIQFLADHQIDFDLGDELLMDEFASVDADGFRIGEMTYQVVILPETMDNLCESTLGLLEEYLHAGGAVVALGEPPQFVNGRADSRPAELARSAGDAWRRLTDHKELLDCIDQLCPRLIATAGRSPLPAGLAHQMRILDDGSQVHLLANTLCSDIDDVVCICGTSLRELDTSTGTSRVLPCESTDNGLAVHLRLLPGQHAVWLVSPQAETPKPIPARASIDTWRIADFDRVERLEPNVLQLDFCDLTAAGETHPGVYVVKADDMAWRAHGLNGNIWRNVQYRRDFIDRQFGAGTGFTVIYRFDIKPDDFDTIKANGELRLAIENPHLYAVTVNGQDVSFDQGIRWFDESIRGVPVSDSIVPGVNHVQLSVTPFHVLAEIDRIYLLGEFGLEESSPGFRMVKSVPLGMGDWAAQGMPFYNGAVRYVKRLELQGNADQLLVRINNVASAATTVQLDEGTPVLTDFELEGTCIPGPITAGEHALTVEVFNTPRNLLGTHFWSPGPPIGKRFTGYHHWLHYHPPAPADGREYELAPYGLTGPVTVECIA